MVLIQCASLGGAGFLVFLIIFLHIFQEAISALRVLNMLSTYFNFNSLGKNLALNLFVHNNAHCMLGDTVDSSSFAMETFVGHSFLNSALPLMSAMSPFL